MRIFFADELGGVEAPDLAALGDRLPGQGYRWIDLSDPPPGWTADEVAGALGLDPAQCGWLGHFGHRTRFEWGQGRLGAVAPAIVDGSLIEVHLLATDTALVTVHGAAPDLFDLVRTRAHDRPPESRGVSDLFLILDDVVATFRPSLEELRATVDDLSEAVLERPSSDVVRRLAEVRHRLLVMRTALMPYDDAIGDFVERLDLLLPGLTASDKALARAHAGRVDSLLTFIAALQDATGHTMETYVSMVATRQGQVINWLTALSMVFLPLTFITGFFGMNFNWMIDGIDSPAMFLLLGIVLQVAVVAVVVLLARARGWLVMVRAPLPELQAGGAKRSG